MKIAHITLSLSLTFAFSACSETAQSTKQSSTNEAATSVGTSTKQAPATIAQPVAAKQVEATPAVVQSKPVVIAAPQPAAEQAVTYDFPSKAPRNLQQRFIEKDADKDGQLNLEEFTAYLAVWLAQNQPGKDPKTAAPGPFMKKDANGDGQLSPQEAF